MGEIPLTTKVKFAEDDIVTFVAYVCNKCKREFLVNEEILDPAYCPCCGLSTDVVLEIEYT